MEKKTSSSNLKLSWLGFWSNSGSCRRDISDPKMKSKNLWPSLSKSIPLELTPLKPLGWRGFKIFIFYGFIWMVHIKQIQFFNDHFMDSNLCRAWIAFALLSCLRLPAWLAASNRVIQWMECGLKGKLEIELGYLPWSTWCLCIRQPYGFWSKYCS